MSHCRSVFALLVALLLFAGLPGIGSLTARCSYCGPHCPMSAKRLGCHDHGDSPNVNCRDRGGLRLASCAHSDETPSGVAWLAIPLPRTDVRPPAAIPQTFIAFDARSVGETLEPPTDPPRLRSVA